MNVIETPIPSHVPRKMVRDFDYFKLPTENRTVHDILYDLLNGPPLFYTTAMGGYWVATRARLFDEILAQPEIFSNYPVVLRAIATGHYKLVPEELDPPEHIKYRRLLSPIFSRTKMQGLAGSIAEITNDLIDNVYAKGECEFVGDIAGPLPMRLFLHMMELPEDHLPMMLGWVNDMMRSADPTIITRAKDAAENYFRELAEARRRKPGEDMMSKLIIGEVDGCPIKEEPLVSMSMVLMQGALDTTTNELTFMARFLAENPDHRQQLLNEPALIPNAVEEMMRHFGIINSIRTIVKDVKLDGVQLKNGDQILMPHYLWGMDPERVKDGRKMDFRREEPQHHLFGAGTHVCAGAPLVRVEIPVFWQEWLKRIPEFRVKPGAKIKTFGGMMMGTEALPLTWTPK